MSKLTDQQKKDYLANPNTCPYCNNEDLDTSPIQTDDNYAWQPVSCDNCGKA